MRVQDGNQVEQAIHGVAPPPGVSIIQQVAVGIKLWVECPDCPLVCQASFSLKTLVDGSQVGIIEGLASLAQTSEGNI